MNLKYEVQLYALLVGEYGPNGEELISRAEASEIGREADRRVEVAEGLAAAALAYIATLEFCSDGYYRVTETEDCVKWTNALATWSAAKGAS